MQQRFIFFAILIAAIMGIAGFLLINMLLSEPDAPPEEPGLDVGEGEPLGEGVAIPPPGQPAQVGGQTVYLTTDPALAVELAPAAMPPAAPTQTLPGIEATATPGPVAVQPTATPPPIAGAPATAAPPVAPGGEGVNPNVDSFITVDYVVQPGDTLFSIAQAQTSSIEKMAEAGIDADDLVPGTVIQLPIANPDYCLNSDPYIVQPGDTVFSLARRNNTTVESIARLNNLGADYTIKIANVLCLPC